MNLKDKFFKIRDFYCKYVESNEPDFCMNKDYLDRNMQIDVYILKNEELEKVHTLFLSNNLSKQDLKKEIEQEMCCEIGKILKDGTIQKEYFRQGYIYKNYENFFKRDGICYVSEHDGNKIGETGVSYEGICNDILNYLVLSGIDVKKVPIRTINEMAFDVFECVDWQYPSSLIEGDQYLDEYIKDLPDDYFFEKEKENEDVKEV